MFFLLSILISFNASATTLCETLFESTSSFDYYSDGEYIQHRRSGYFLERDSERGYYFEGNNQFSNNLLNDSNDSRFIENDSDHSSSEFLYKDNF